MINAWIKKSSENIAKQSPFDSSKFKEGLQVISRKAKKSSKIESSIWVFKQIKDRLLTPIYSKLNKTLQKLSTTMSKTLKVNKMRVEHKSATKVMISSPKAMANSKRMKEY